MKINREISPYNYSNGNNVQYIVIHSTGNVNDTAKNNADYFYRADRGASAHYFVDDNEIWQVVEEYNQAWHCGDGGNRYGIGNNNSIGIEMCGTENGYISERTINNTIELVKYLMKKYNISIQNVVRHYDASRKMCPFQFSSNNWARWFNFKKRLIRNNTTTINKNEGMVIADVLNVRDKPNGNIIGQLHYNDFITINKKVRNWYDIYYGDHGGYVSADYIKTDFGKTVATTTKVQQRKYRNLVIYANDVDRRAAEYLADYFSSLGEDGKAMSIKDYRVGMGVSVWAVGGGLDNIKANAYLKGSNRFDTLKAVCKKINLF